MKRLLIFIIAASSILAGLSRQSLGAQAPDAEPLIRIAEGKIYAVVNDENVLGREVLDVLVETFWQQYLPPFIAYTIRNEEVEKSKIELKNEEVDVEAKLYLTAQFGAMLDLEKLKKEAGAGAVDALIRTVRADLGLLKVFQERKQLKDGAHVTSPEFTKLKNDFLQKRIDELGVITDPKVLGEGEAVRIGPRSYSNDEVRRFILESEGQLSKATLGEILQQLRFEKVIKAEAARKSLTLSDDDRKFHFSYLCRIKELETGAPGRAVMMQNLQQNKMTVDQFLHSRVFTCDALATLVVKQPIREQNLRAAFAVNPKKYQTTENLTAHIFIPVLDPDGHPYNTQWRSNHFGPDAYVGRKREEQFLAVKPKIEGLLPLAKENFDETARKYSEDVTKKASGLIGRIGARTIPAPPLDKKVVDAAIKLQPGQISDCVRSDFGWHILKCLEKQDVTYDEVKEAIYLNLIYEARNELVTRLLKDSKYEEKN